MTSSSSRRVALLSLAIVPGLLLAGCSSTSSPASPGGAVASAKSVASAVASAQGKSAAPAPAGPITTGDQLCKLVPLADAQGAMAANPPLTQQVSKSGLENEPGCGYTDAKITEILSVYLYPLKDNPFDGTKPIMAGDTLKAVAGLGDKAGVNKDELDVLKGDTVISIETAGPTDLTEDQLIAVGKLFASRL